MHYLKLNLNQHSSLRTADMCAYHCVHSSWRVVQSRDSFFGIERCSILCDFDARQSRASKTRDKIAGVTSVWKFSLLFSNHDSSSTDLQPSNYCRKLAVD